MKKGWKRDERDSKEMERDGNGRTDGRDRMGGRDGRDGRGMEVVEEMEGGQKR